MQKRRKFSSFSSQCQEYRSTLSLLFKVFFKINTQNTAKTNFRLIRNIALRHSDRYAHEPHVRPLNAGFADPAVRKPRGSVANEHRRRCRQRRDCPYNCRRRRCGKKRMPFPEAYRRSTATLFPVRLPDAIERFPRFPPKHYAQE